jgi:co-chaperonin GroES (HSP10)
MSKKKITFKPTRDWILLPDPRKEETESGIYLPESVQAKIKDNILEVLAVGPEAKWVKAGDTVMIDPSGKGHIISLDEVPHVMVPEFMVLGVM